MKKPKPQRPVPSKNESSTRSDSRNQGEGDYQAARRYRNSVEHFISTADIERAARDAAPRNEREAAELAQAEAAGRRRAKRPAARRAKSR